MPREFIVGFVNCNSNEIQLREIETDLDPSAQLDMKVILWLLFSHDEIRKAYGLNGDGEKELESLTFQFLMHRDMALKLSSQRFH